VSTLDGSERPNDIPSTEIASQPGNEGDDFYLPLIAAAPRKEVISLKAQVIENPSRRDIASHLSNEFLDISDGTSLLEF